LIERVRTASKRRARAAVDRVVVPYFERLADELRPTADHDGGHVPAAASNGVPSDYFHRILHELRSVELEQVPKGARRAVSVGAAGRWYFDWFENAVGPLDEHIGVEAFEPEPDDLPPYARWIATTADRLDGIDDNRVDIVFAGQTTEHLWADELAGFLLQSRRVLAATGVLVLDSPNRLVTEHLRWSHGGHTVELSVAEIVELLTLAGFRTDDVRGLWRCRFGDEVLQLEERLDDGALLVRRIVEGTGHPDDSFVWWLVARPDGTPDEAALRARTDELYRAHWPTRVCRGMWPGPGVDAIDFAPGAEQAVASLPFMLATGRWRIGIELAAGTLEDLDLRIDITAPGGHLVHRLEKSAAATSSASTVIWELDQGHLALALSIELHVACVTAPVSVNMPLTIEAA
jgi:hypothetical protein